MEMIINSGDELIELIEAHRLSKSQITEICTKALGMAPVPALTREELINEIRVMLEKYPDATMRPLFLGRHNRAAIKRHLSSKA